MPAVRYGAARVCNINEHGCCAAADKSVRARLLKLLLLVLCSAALQQRGTHEAVHCNADVADGSTAEQLSQCGH